MIGDGPTPGLRREPGPDLDGVGEDEALVERIRDEIRRTGPMPFARFMTLALTDPDGGYYRSAEARPGRAGDFLTAPELHPIFGATLATGLRDLWERLGRPAPFQVREHGAGTGTLARAILDELARTPDDPFLTTIRYAPVDIDERRLAAFATALAEAGHADRIVAADPTPFVGVVLANEVLDALPVHRVRRRGDRLVEVAVVVAEDGRLAETEVDPTTPALAARLAEEGIALAEGQTAEVCLVVEGWLAAAIQPLRRGAVVVIDYGYEAARLYDPVRRRDGTLRAYLRHRVHDDPYIHVGRQDLTAHVDITAVQAAAHRLGLTTVGLTTQAEALMGLGIQDRLQAVQADPATTMADYTLLRSALQRLLDPAAMGRFQVLLLGRDWPATPAGASPLRFLSFRLPDRSAPPRRDPD